MIIIQFDKAQLASVQQRLSAIPRRIPAVLAAAVNATAKQEKTLISSGIRERVNIKKKDIDPNITFSRATPSSPQSLLRLSKTKRLNLKYFGARQTKHGVTYQIAKAGGRKTAPHAFGPGIAKLHGFVIQRVGKQRLPTRELRGPSPWGVFVKSGMRRPTIESIEKLLRKNLEQRVNYELLKHSGAIKQ